MGFGDSGILVVDKPRDLSSAQAVARIKRILRVPKIGHTGTLDPMATGVLVCCLNQATKLVPLLQVGQKAYNVCLHLGIETDTQDATGTTVCIRSVRPREADALVNTVGRFVGEIEQQPPVYSALKHQGVALYRLARRGQPVQKPGRKVHIADIRIRRIDWPLVHMTVDCSKGTYIRTLCADIGRALGWGGHMRKLRRTANGPFDLCQALTFAQLDAAAEQGQARQLVRQKMIGMSDALPKWPEVLVDDTTRKRIADGVLLNSAMLPGIGRLPADAYIKLIDSERSLLALARLAPEGDKLKYFRVFVRN